MPIIDIIIDFCYTPGAKLGTKIGVMSILIIMIMFHFISLIIFLYSNSFSLFLLSISLFGIGTGISNLTYIRNVWKFFPNNQGFIYGIIISSSGIFSTFITILADFFIINPNKENTINGIYPKDVANNVQLYIIIISSLIASVDIIGSFLIFDYENIPETQEDQLRIHSKNNLDMKINSGPYLNTEISSFKKENIKLMSVFFSKINFKLFLFCFCGFCKYYIIILYV